MPIEPVTARDAERNQLISTRAQMVWQNPVNANCNYAIAISNRTGSGSTNFDIVISSGKGWMKLNWDLTKDEKKLLLKKMNEEVMRVDKKSLFDIYISEQKNMV